MTTTNSFRIRGLPARDFSHLFGMSDAQLAELNARRTTALDGGYPCRVSLTDATPGDTVILVNYQHHPVDTPYRSCFAVYVREGEQTFDAVDEVPAQLRRRLLSLRGYDAGGMLLVADVIDGQQLEAGIEPMLANEQVAYIHVHFAKPGCYAAMIERAG
ncbi:MAG TPA: DUF1203 domain-containing protein [Povalibacter sp.]|nr:DUF1203 domain-containing protein [Povalibacter sp.]